MLENSVDASEKLAPLLVQIDTTAQSIEAMAEQISLAGGSLNRYIDSSGSGVTQFSQQTLPELGSLVRELRRLANTLQHVGEKIEDDPRAILFGSELQQPGPGE